ncbi:MAG: 3-phosphoshikimate 1-carboxyvinyltransferase [Bacteroidaceae bacterium]|nr:3-phosphoshikimate 1-carboxyvinyltransferase [Bacteroidaceae bacterium]
MRLTFGKSNAVGTVQAPPSKSYAHRLLIAAALSCGRVDGLAPSQDILATVDCLRALGFECGYDGKCAVFGTRRDLLPGSRIVLPCRESGSTMRFIIPLALALAANGTEFLITGSDRLLERGIAPYVKTLSKVSFRYDTDGIVMSGRLEPGDFMLDASTSSQYLTGLMMALPLCAGDSCIRLENEPVSRGYLDITQDVLSQAGIRLEWQGGRQLNIPGGQHYSLPASAKVEGDWTNAAYLEIYNFIDGNKVDISGLRGDSAQGDRVCREMMFRLVNEGQVDISENIDLGPVLFTLAVLNGKGRITGTRRLAIKESDRVGDMVSELEAFGVEARVSENEVDISAPQLHAPSRTLNGHNDHRLVMALVPLLTVFTGSIDGAEAVSKSFPDYFEVLTELGIGYDRR